MLAVVGAYLRNQLLPTTQLLAYCGGMDEVDRKLSDKPPHEQPPFVDMVVGPKRTSDNRRFGELLADLRNRAGLSRADAAVALGVTAEYLRLIELGKRTPALGQMRSFLDAYRVKGEIGSIQPGGDRPDLIFFHPLSDNPVIVEFKSRIREAGRRTVGPASDLADRQKNPDEQRLALEHPSAERATELGLVVLLLARADDGTIRKVRDLLQDEVR